MQLDLLPSIVVLGLTVAALYGLLPVAIVLTYRISRTIGFVHGGIAIFGALTYSVLVNGTPSQHGGDFAAHGPDALVDPKLALLGIVIACAVLGAAFGALVMSRWMAELPGLTLTVISVAGLLVIGNLSGYYITPGATAFVPSPFGDGGTRVADVVVTDHRLATFGVLVAIVAGLTVFLNRTYTGLSIRAFADDVEAGVWCGANLRRIGTGVYAGAGAIAGLAGALYAAAVAEAIDGMLLLLARGLLIAVVGGLRSIPLALAGAMVYGVLETALVVDFFGGDLNAGMQELILNCALLTMIVIAARYRKESFFLLERRNA